MTPERALELVAEYCAEVPAQCSDGEGVDMDFTFVGGSVTGRLARPRSSIRVGARPST